LLVAGALALGGCAGLGGANPLSPARARISVSSPAFTAGGAIPPRYTCDGDDISPPLRWSGIPRASHALDLVMRDRDAPGGSFIHWQLTGIPASIDALAAGQVPPGVKVGRNDFHRVGYGGPCPPAGPAHHYVITLTSKAGAAVTGVGTLVGTYARR
jgi:Raf kinase inhibitor-like YbhB/YbcL family protein